MNKNTSGFTIVELLIVIVVIAILAAISIVAYNGIQNRTHDTAVQQDLRGLATLLGLYHAERGSYPDVYASGIPQQLRPYGTVKVSKDSYDPTGIHGSPVSGAYDRQFNYLYCRSGTDATKFALIAKSRSGITFQLSDGTVSRFGGVEPAGAHTLCDAAGIADSSGATRAWLYHDGAWQSGIAS